MAAMHMLLAWFSGKLLAAHAAACSALDRGRLTVNEQKGS